MGRMNSFWQSRLAPFSSVSFRRFFMVHTFSLVGLWAFDLARSWLVVSGLGMAGELGLVLMAGAVPGFFFALYGGVIVDRVDVRKMMIVTKLVLAVLSLLLAYFSEFHEIRLWHLVLFGFIQGSVTAVDGPTYHKMLVRLVPRHDYQQALSINSTIFHASRALGPVIAGFLMAVHGPSLVFLFDGISYFGLIFVLMKLKMNEAPKNGDAYVSPWTDFFEGVRYVFTAPRLRYMVLQLFAGLCLMLPVLVVILRTYIKDKFDVGAAHFGYIFMLPAAGALLGALSFTFLKPRMPLKALNFGIPFGILAVLTIQTMNTPLAAGIMMGLGGFAVYFCFASLTVTLNLEVEERFRGRMASLLTMGFHSLGPLLSYPIGAISDKIGYEPAMTALALIYGGLSCLIYFKHFKSLRVRAV